jgi:hypothetical protein
VCYFWRLANGKGTLSDHFTSRCDLAFAVGTFGCHGDFVGYLKRVERTRLRWPVFPVLSPDGKASGVVLVRSVVRRHGNVKIARCWTGVTLGGE